MEIVEETADRLKLQGRGLGRTMMLLGLLLVGLPLVAIASALQTSTLICVRPQSAVVQCQVRQSLLGVTLNTTSLTLPIRVEIVQHYSQNGSYYAVQLIDPHQTLELTPYSTRTAAEQVVAEINRFGADQGQPSLKIVKAGNARGVPIFLLLMLIGGGLETVSVLQSRATWTFDKPAGLAVHERPTLTGRQRTEYLLSEVVGVTMEDRWGSRGGQAYRVSLLLTDPERVVPLTETYTSGAADKEQVVARLELFLGVSQLTLAKPPPSGWSTRL